MANFLHGGGALLLPAVLVAGLLSASPASADDAFDSDDHEGNRAYAVMLWQSGGAGIKEGAEQALLGTDEDVNNFLRAAGKIRDTDDRVDVTRMVNTGGPGVREAAVAALRTRKPQDVRAFLAEGWKAPLRQDQRVEAISIVNSGGPGVKDAGKLALQGTPEDVKQFLTVGQYKARRTDDRVEATSLFNSGGPALKAAAKLALQGTPEDVTEFLEVGQFTARGRDQEHASVQQLVEQAERAGARAEEATKAAVEAKDRAVAASKQAMLDAQEAALQTKAAKDDAGTAAAMAQQAAEAARGAAEASQRAIDAASAANRSSRLAAMAAAQTASAASAAAEAANRAYSSSIAAMSDASKADDALSMAKQARMAQALVLKSALAAGQAKKASLAAADAVVASRSASANSRAAADAADQANQYADAAGVHSEEARKAAAETRRHAAEADRAADAAEALARKSAAAASAAQTAANKAAEHAGKAADAAEAAVKHAGDAALAAKESSTQAAAAKAAADAADTAVAAAKSVFEVARETEAQDLATRTAAATERAKSQKAAANTFTSQVARVVLEGKAIDDATAALATEADKPGADPKAVAAQGRAVAMRAMKHFGSWRQSAAALALSGTDSDVLDYLRAGAKKAASDEIRQQVADLASDSPYEKVRTAAADVLKGSAQQIADFHATGQYQVANVDYRVLITSINNDGGPSIKEASKAALADGSVKALTGFLNSGRYLAQNIDERVIATTLYNDGGPELKAAAFTALNGPADQLHDFVQVGQYMADRKDQLTSNHIAQMEGLLNQASRVAANARENSWRAAQAAALAQHANAEAQTAAGEAVKSAQRAKDYASYAKDSAQKADASATKATKAAATGRKAADRADRDAEAADQSAARAEFSARYARSSADWASTSKYNAKEAALAAGKSAAEASAIADQAWADVVVKREAELAEARRQDEEQRKQWKEEQREAEELKKRTCTPNPFSERDTAFVQCVARNGDRVILGTYEPPEFLKKVVLELTGVQDIIDCVNDPALGKCLFAVGGVLPLGKLKLLKKAAEGVEDIAEGSRFAKAAKCAQCFLAGTKVLMADKTTKNIDDVQIGDQVLATDPLTGTTGQRRVTHLIVTEHDKHFNDLTITTPQGPEHLTATHEHPFWSPSQQAWTIAGALQKDMTLLTPDGATVEVSDNHSFNRNARTYNLTVEDLHTYYVLAGETPVLVHNSSCSISSAVADETRSGMGSIVSKHSLNADQALDVGLEFLGPGYKELGKNRGVFRSADGLRQFRIDPDSLDGNHWPDVRHIHLQIFAHPGDKKSLVNNHIPLIGD
ncbi:polymorphic toxin-type HINT domain-containing protein [Streptomyces xanthochromogenes]|uniref:polymorphic toxin-type HINT domain-containing protein n=1 Tax=Streptomyces xanthochromogenes TaxID=67384 RepID=UPI00341CAC4F